LKLIVFDCDGTLVDSQHMIVSAMERAFAVHELVPLPREKILSVVGLSLSLAVSRLVPNMDAARIDQLAEDYKSAFGDLRRDPDSHEPLYPGVREMLHQLAARDDVALGIATGKSRRGVAAILARENLGELFQTIQTADTHPSKPDPSMLITAMADAGSAPHDTIMIGDTTFDMDMARAAGVRAIGVSWGYHPSDALTAAHVIVHGADALHAELNTFLPPAKSTA
jgi:phosphoglycolate phosphatase